MQDSSQSWLSLAVMFTHENTDRTLVFEMLQTWADGAGWMATSKAPRGIPFSEGANVICIFKGQDLSQKS